MLRTVSLVTPPAAEPITLEEARLHLRVTGTEEDSLITSLVTASRRDLLGEAATASGDSAMTMNHDAATTTTAVIATGAIAFAVNAVIKFISYLQAVR